MSKKLASTLMISNIPESDEQKNADLLAMIHFNKRIHILQNPRDDPSLVTYVWIDGTGIGLRSKTRVLAELPSSGVTSSDIPEWNFDGSSTAQSSVEASDIILKPVRIYKDPFFVTLRSYLVLCETYHQNGSATATNHRKRSKGILDKCRSSNLLFGIEQEYSLVNKQKVIDYYQKYEYDHVEQTKPYCGTGSQSMDGRYVCDLHLQACIYAGIKMAGTNAEVNYGQWEFQLAPSEGLLQADNLWMARYILIRVAEEFKREISFHPKYTGQGTPCNGSGAHTNFSTALMMNKDGGMNHINKAIELLQKKHTEHLRVYDINNGRDNSLRLTGTGEAPSANKFVHGISDRTASVRIPDHVLKNGCGYIEDRRPASNCDPYLVCERIALTIVLEQ